MPKIRKAVGIVIYDICETGSTEARHGFCDKDFQWYKMYILERKGGEYNENPGLPFSIRNKMVPIFKHFFAPELREKCLDWKTQYNH